MNIKKVIVVSTSPSTYESFIQIDGEIVDNATAILMLLKRIKKLEKASK